MDKIISQSRGMYDLNLRLKSPSGSLASWGNGGGFAVAAVAKIIDLGSNAFVAATAVIDVDAMDSYSAAALATDSQYFIAVQGSRSATFASGIEELALIRLAGKQSAKANNVFYSGDRKSRIGRYFLPFTNERNGDYFQYLRGWGSAGAVAATLNMTMFITK